MGLAKRFAYLLALFLMASHALAAHALAAEPSTRPYVLHLPGIAGLTGIDRAMGRGLEAGADAEVEYFDWTGDEPGIAALQAYARNRATATDIAAKLARFASENPTRPITLSSHSGGTGLAVWALEAMPKDTLVQTVLLIAPALSTDYDLSNALCHVQGKCFAFSSKLDVVMLGAGTKLFGTIDGVFEPAAGLTGFVQPPEADPKQYAKLVAVPYQSRWLAVGNIGDHIGPMSGLFARKVLARIISGNDEVLVAPATAPSAQPMEIAR